MKPMSQGPGSLPDPRHIIGTVEAALPGWESEIHPQTRKSGTGMLTFRARAGTIAVVVNEGEFINASFVSADGQDSVNRVESLEELSDIYG